MHDLTSNIEDRTPQIETVYPLRRDAHGSPQPFPTIYWLTDPALDRAIADLERQGAVGQIEQALRDDPDLMRMFRQDHERYRETRWAMLTDADRAIVEASESLSRPFRGGVAGVADFTTIKCLHAQAAHHLADRASGGQGNTAARVVIERFDLAF